MKNYQALFVAFGGLFSAYNVINGSLQQYIPFNNPLSELFFVLFGIMLGIIGIVSINYKKLINALN